MNEEYRNLVIKLASRLALLAPRNKSRSLEWNTLAWIEHFTYDNTENAVLEVSSYLKENFDIPDLRNKPIFPEVW